MKSFFVEGYLGREVFISRRIDVGQVVKVIEVLEKKLKENKTIYVAGNGGSAATASHMVCDLAKTSGKPFKVICLSDNISFLTAVGNDISYDEAFSERLKNLGQSGDLLLVITGSGNSKNIIRAVEMAKTLKMDTMAFLGFDGGKVKGLVDNYILIPSDDYGPIEDFHMILVHLITGYFKKLHV